MQLMRIYILSTHSVRWHVAAGVSSRENVDDAIELGFSGEELEIRKNELIFYVHGQKLMELAHNIYQRCCK